MPIIKLYPSPPEQPICRASLVQLVSELEHKIEELDNKKDINVFYLTQRNALKLLIFDEHKLNCLPLLFNFISSF